jgi:hypothetical protein
VFAACLLSLLGVMSESLRYKYSVSPSQIRNFFFILTLLAFGRSRMYPNGATRTPLYVGASSIVEAPPGVSLAEFLIASKDGYVLLSFHRGFSFALGLEEELTKVSYFI